MAKIYLSLATFAYNTFNSLNIANYSPYELVFGRKPKILLNLDTVPDIKEFGRLRDYHKLLTKRLKYLHELYKVLGHIDWQWYIKMEHFPI